MKYSLIGCGRIAINHLKAAVSSDLSIEAVCDIVPERVENVLSRMNIKSVGYSDYKQMLAEKKPELVAIATESGKHAAIAIDCINAGCNVIIEKPIALSITDADRIIENAKEKGVKVCACHQNRFNCSIQHLRQAIEKGRFGMLSHGSAHIRWNRGEDYYRQAPWRGTWDQDGGALMNQSIHAIDILRWMMGGEIEEVFGYTARQFHPYIECEDVGLAVVKFKNGAIGSVEGTTNVFPENLEETLYIFGENGTVKVGGKSMNKIETWKFTNRHSEDKELEVGFDEKVADIYGNGHTPLYADMIEAIRYNREPYIPAEEGKRVLELVLAIYKSAKIGGPVKFPLESYDGE